MPLTHEYLERVQNIFWKGYEKSLHYEHEKDDFFSELRKLKASIEKKIAGSELGDTISKLICTLESANWASDESSFRQNINQFIRGGIGKKLTKSECEALWLLHKRGFVKFPHHKLSKFLDLLKHETAFMGKAQVFMNNLHEKLERDAPNTERLRSVMRLLDVMISYSYRLEDLTLSQSNNLRAANLDVLLSVRKEEMYLKKEIQNNLSSMLERNPGFKERFQPGRLRRALRLGIVVICLTISVVATALASDLTRQALPEKSIMPGYLEHEAKKSNIDVVIKWEKDVPLQNGVTKAQVEETITEAAKFAASHYKGTPLTPSNVQIQIGFGRHKSELTKSVAFYEYSDNIVYISPHVISTYFAGDARIFSGYSFIVHEVVHYMDFNSYKLPRQFYGVFANWLNGLKIHEDKEFVEHVLKTVVEFSDMTESNAMNIQLVFLQLVLEHGWASLEKLSEYDSASKGLLKSAISMVEESLEMVQKGEYGDKRRFAQMIRSRYHDMYAESNN